MRRILFGANFNNSMRTHLFNSLKTLNLLHPIHSFNRIYSFNVIQLRVTTETIRRPQPWQLPVPDHGKKLTQPFKNKEYQYL